MSWMDLRRFLDALAARLGPFLDLLDARYLPLLAVVAPQAWTVYAWLLRDGAPSAIAVAGGLGYEAVYVGAVAWAERGAGWSSARPPAVAALLFSVAVAVAYYAPALGPIAVLHAGFPIVAYAYTVSMHAAVRPRPAAASIAEQGAEPPALPAGQPPALPDGETITIGGRAYSVRAVAEAARISPSTLSDRLAAVRTKE